MPVPSPIFPQSQSSPETVALWVPHRDDPRAFGPLFHISSDDRLPLAGDLWCRAELGGVHLIGDSTAQSARKPERGRCVEHCCQGRGLDFLRAMGPDKVSSCPTLIHARPLSRKLLKSSPMIPDPLTCFPPTANQHYARAARNTAKMAITFHVAASASASSVVARNQRSNSQATSLESAKQRSVAMRMRGGACRAKLRPTSGVDCQGALKPTRAPCCGTSTRAAARASHPPPSISAPLSRIPPTTTWAQRLGQSFSSPSRP